MPLRTIGVRQTSDHFPILAETSDHFPILAELHYKPKSAARQEAPEADADDRAEAVE